MKMLICEGSSDSRRFVQHCLKLLMNSVRLPNCCHEQRHKKRHSETKKKKKKEGWLFLNQDKKLQ